MSNQDIVRDFYNAKPPQTIETRKKSPLYRVRGYNNWVKTQLIQTVAVPNMRVLDLCCGKGGDLQKFANVDAAHVVGVDIAAQSIEEAKTRYRQLVESKDVFSAEFFVGDMARTTLSNHYTNPHQVFDLVNCQFALHYAFESEQKAHKTFENISERLVPGGFFICTLPSEQFFVGGNYSNSLFHFKLNKPFSEKVHFGQTYHFHLRDAVDAPEYIVMDRVLQKVARSHGLDVVQKRDLLDFEPDAIYGRFVKGTLNKDERDVIGFYTSYIFQKQ